MKNLGFIGLSSKYLNRRKVKVKNGRSISKNEIKVEKKRFLYFDFFLKELATEPLENEAVQNVIMLNYEKTDKY